MRRPKIQVSSDVLVGFYFIQELALKKRSAPGIIVSANFQGSMILMLCSQEHANLIPLNRGYDNFKSMFPVIQSEIFRLNYTVQCGKKVYLLIENLLHMQCISLLSRF